MRKPQSTQEELESFEKKRIVLQGKEAGLTPFIFGVPIIVLLLTVGLTHNIGIALTLTILSAVISGIVRHFTVGIEYNTLKVNVRKALVREFMSTYHPETEYKFFQHKKIVKEIVRQSGLVPSANRYYEEDVISGTHKGAEFYFSEIQLKRKKDKSSKTKFKGILFRIKIPGKSFPKSKIQSRQGLFSSVFGNFIHNTEFDFFIESKNQARLEKELRPLFPFIAHLKARQGDVRISTAGDEIVLLMNSNMKLLDDPHQHIDQTFLLEEYKTKVARQLNTLLFIVDSFVNNADTSEIEERLELKTLVEVKKEI